MNTEEPTGQAPDPTDERPAPQARSRKKVPPAQAEQAQAATENVAGELLETTEGTPADDSPSSLDEAPATPAAEAAAPDTDAPVAIDDVLSGRFDAEADAPAGPPKRVLLPQADTPKLHKVLAQAGLGSRLEMEQLILEGRISVNNQPAHVGQRIQFGDTVKVNGRPIKVRIAPPPARVLAYHKPVGEVVTHDDPQNRPTVFRKLPRLMQGKWQSVGRLDLNSEGLLLLTNDGGIKRKLELPSTGWVRKYRVRVNGSPADADLAPLRAGITVEGERFQPMSVTLDRQQGALHGEGRLLGGAQARHQRVLVARIPPVGPVMEGEDQEE